ncbi:SGNH/GDSL hydrolase family protein, partial [Streptomyces sp. NPDC005904]
FAKQHLVPWIGRRLTGRSSGDGRPPKRPELLPYDGPLF